MARQWPVFVTADLGDTEADSLEMERRWTVYRDEMAALIAAGGVHQDADRWWIDDASGELIGPDPEIERPLTMMQAPRFLTIDDALPDLAEKLRKARGRQKIPTKVSTTIRLSPEVIDRFRATGPGWQARIDAVLKDWIAAH